VQANFGAPKFVFPCRALHKPPDFVQNMLDVDFEPFVHMTAIWYSNPNLVRLFKPIPNTQSLSLVMIS